MGRNPRSRSKIINNTSTEEAISTLTILVVKWLEVVEESVDEVYHPLCGGLYKKKYGSIVPC